MNRRERAKAAAPLDGEVQFKRWCMDEAERNGCTFKGIQKRFYRGKYDGLELRKVNKRVVFVKI